MNNQEGPRQPGIFGFARRGTTAPTSDPLEIGSIPEGGVRGPTREEVETANAGNLLNKIERTVINTAKRHPFRVGSAAIAVGGAIAGSIAAIEASQDNTPGIHRSVENNALPRLIFDNRPDKGTISTNNSITVSTLEGLKNLDAIIPQSSQDGHTVNILLPLQGLPPSGKVEYDRDLTGKNSFNPIYAPESRQYALENGIKNEIFLKNIPAGSTILAPVDGEFMYNRIRNELPDGTIDGPTFFFKDENGILYQILISDAAAKPLASILDVPARGIEDDYRKFLHPIKKGEPIATVLQQGEIAIFAQAWPSGQSGIEKSSNGEHLRPVNISFLTNQQQQLVVIEK